MNSRTGLGSWSPPRVFEALRPIDVQHVVRGQYQGYRSEPGVTADSDTETMVAVRAELDNWRWRGVPFFLRSGKAMGASRQIVTLGVHQPPLRMFRADLPDPAADRINEIVIDFADPGSISTGFLAKIPGPELALGHATMRFNYKDSFAMANALEGYERLILLAMMGDQSLFTRSDGSSGCGRSPRPFWATRRRSSRTPAARGGRSRSASSSRRTAGTCPSVSAAVMRGLSWRMDRPPPAPSETPSSSSVSRSRPS